MMAKLRAVPKASRYYKAGPPSEISVGPGGQLQIRCDDNETYGWLSSLLSDRLFVQGQGFPRFRRDANGVLTRDPKTGKFQVERYVDLAQDERSILEAIRDNLEATEQFVLTLED